MGHLLNIDSNWTKKMLKKGMRNLNKGYILPHSLIVFKFKQFLFARIKYYCTACSKVKMNWDNVTKDYCSSRFLYRAWILDVMLIALVSNVTQLVWLSNFAQCWLPCARQNPIARIPWAPIFLSCLVSEIQLFVYIFGRNSKWPPEVRKGSLVKFFEVSYYQNFF